MMIVLMSPIALWEIRNYQYGAQEQKLAFKWNNSSFTVWKRLYSIMDCHKQPLSVNQNATFIVDQLKLPSRNDVFADDMGV